MPPVALPSLPEPSAAACDRALALLSRRLGSSKVLDQLEARERFATDDSDTGSRTPDCVVLAETEDDIATTLAVARETSVPVTPRGAGTGRTGGATPIAGGIVLSMLGMNRIKHIDRRERVAVVGPGVVLGELHRAVEAEGLFYPPDPNSLSTCCIGGNLAENAGGPRAFKYGVTREYVLGMDAFLMGGQRIFAGKRTVKGVTGYDVASLLVGSEGTLAVLGDVTLRLVPNPDSVVTLLALFASAEHAMNGVTDVLTAGITPRCIEFLDEGTLQALRDAGNAIDTRAHSLLLIELDGDAATCDAQTERIAGALDEGKVLDLVVAREGAQREKLWAARREMTYAVRRKAKHKLSEDVVVPRTRLTELLSRIDAERERTSVRTMSYGHAGDGNLHVNFLWDDEEERRLVDQGIERLFRDVVELGGTLSGEHGIGIAKAPYLPLEQSAELIALQRDLKRVFDPENLLNPGKIFPLPGHKAC